MQQGNISVQAENIFPIIKKFLYSEHDIFLRELISNAVDATSKLKAVATSGELNGEVGETTIDVKVDKEAKTITFSDRGIGLTDEEAKKYLNQLAFSSAQEFLDKYKDDVSVIGHFGLGFYSAFMVADKVEVESLSYKEGAQAIRWTCEGDPSYTIEDIDKSARGTDIILHISEDSEEFLEESRVEELLNKYCKFLPVPIRFGTRKETIEEGEGDDKTSKEIEVDNIINNTNPAWKKSPSELTDEDYINFYKELHPFSPEPMFWVHLNVDHPFNLTGILYFPKLANNFEVQKSKIQLFSNQVFVTDEVKEIVPEFLTLLHGVIDSPDIPLNVSRSYLQGDPNVKKISGYITKKVAQKLESLFKNERETFEEKWEDLSVFVKYGMISEEKFYDRAQKFALVKNTDGELATVTDFRDKIKEAQTNKYDKVVMLYTNNPVEHYSLVDACKDKGYQVLVFDHMIDNHFIQHLETKMNDITFVRVDSESIDKLVEKDENRESVLDEKDQETVKGVFEGVLNNPTASVVLTPLSPEDPPVQITKPEFMRRMKEMQMMQGMNFGDFPDSFNVIVNSNHPLVVEKLLSSDDQTDLARYLYDLALLNQNMLKGEELTNFVKRSMKFVS